MPIRRGVGYLAATASVVLAGTVMAGPASGADATINYVALGDSYSSGTGTRDYDPDSGDCLRGPKAYPQLWADSHDVSKFDFVACSGATTDDVNSDQLSALTEDTSLVTISAGGNDIGFSDVIQKCLLGSDSDCDGAAGEFEGRARDELPGKLKTIYGKITEAAPNAKVVVVGYPRLNDLGDCGIPGYTEAKRKRTNDAADVLAGVIGDAAKDAGFDFADPREAFDGHGVCSDSEYVNGPSTPLRESFHPNVDGHAEGYLPTVNGVTD